MSSQYRVGNWRASVRETPVWKRALYAGLRPLLSIAGERAFTPEFLSSVRPDGICPERGYPLEVRRRKARPGRSLRGLTVLVQGTGTGWDVVSWAALRPERIIATDLFSFESWEDVSRECKNRFGVQVDFRQASLEDLPWLPDNSIDICASDAVFEHCRNLGSVIVESSRILRSGGTLYATYGPMWFCAGGDHFSGRGGLEHVFAHIEYDELAYKEYFNSHLLAEEDFQSGGRYVQLDLFSKLTTRDYLELFADNGFRREWLVVESSSLALKFRNAYPLRWRALLNKWRGRCEEDDFLVKAHFIRLRNL